MIRYSIRLTGSVGASKGCLYDDTLEVPRLSLTKITYACQTPFFLFIISVFDLNVVFFTGRLASMGGGGMGGGMGGMPGGMGGAPGGFGGADEEDGDSDDDEDLPDLEAEGAPEEV